VLSLSRSRSRPSSCLTLQHAEARWSAQENERIARQLMDDPHDDTFAQVHH
jgi:hypothetical protein